MDDLLALFAILGALLVGAISPGPSFVFVVRTAVAQSRLEGLAAALGMGVGAFLYGASPCVGLRTLMAEGGWLFLAPQDRRRALPGLSRLAHLAGRPRAGRGPA